VAARKAELLIKAGAVVHVIAPALGQEMRRFHQAAQASDAKGVGPIGKALRAGTNCGACIPELTEILARALG